MRRLEVREWDWLVRTRSPVPDLAQADLNECLGATIVVDRVYENGDVEGVVIPGGPHDSNGIGGQFVFIKAESLIADFFVPDPRLSGRRSSAEAA